MPQNNVSAFENQKLGKVYKLCSEKKIAEIFKTGAKLYKFPFTLHYTTSIPADLPPFQIVVGVPKRNFKKAKDRNNIKRKIKEVIRKNKLLLESFLINENLHLSFFLLYNAKENLTYGEIEKKTIQFIHLLIEKLKNEKNVD